MAESFGMMWVVVEWSTEQVQRGSVDSTTPLPPELASKEVKASRSNQILGIAAP
jgi:hypothetical protein